VPPLVDAFLKAVAVKAVETQMAKRDRGDAGERKRKKQRNKQAKKDGKFFNQMAMMAEQYGMEVDIGDDEDTASAKVPEKPKKRSSRLVPTPALLRCTLGSRNWILRECSYPGCGKTLEAGTQQQNCQGPPNELREHCSQQCGHPVIIHSIERAGEAETGSSASAVLGRLYLLLRAARGASIVRSSIWTKGLLTRLKDAIQAALDKAREEQKKVMSEGGEWWLPVLLMQLRLISQRALQATADSHGPELVVTLACLLDSIYFKLHYHWLIYFDPERSRAREELQGHSSSWGVNPIAVAGPDESDFSGVPPPHVYLRAVLSVYQVSGYTMNRDVQHLLQSVQPARMDTQTHTTRLEHMRKLAKSWCVDELDGEDGNGDSKKDQSDDDDDEDVNGRRRGKKSVSRFSSTEDGTPKNELLEIFQYRWQEGMILFHYSGLSAKHATVTLMDRCARDTLNKAKAKELTTQGKNHERNRRMRDKRKAKKNAEKVKEKEEKERKEKEQEKGSEGGEAEEAESDSSESESDDEEQASKPAAKEVAVASTAQRGAARSSGDGDTLCVYGAMPPCYPLLQQWRDACRDWCCHLYAYAVPSPRALTTVAALCSVKLKPTLATAFATAGMEGEAFVGAKQKAKAKEKAKQKFLRYGKQSKQSKAEAAEADGGDNAGASSGGGLLEVGAGTGYWCHLLRECYGVDCLAYDVAPPPSAEELQARQQAERSAVNDKRMDAIGGIKAKPSKRSKKRERQKWGEEGDDGASAEYSSNEYHAEVPRFTDVLPMPTAATANVLSTDEAMLPKERRGTAFQKKATTGGKGEAKVATAEEDDFMAAMLKASQVEGGDDGEEAGTVQDGKPILHARQLTGGDVGGNDSESEEEEQSAIASATDGVIEQAARDGRSLFLCYPPPETDTSSGGSAGDGPKSGGSSQAFSRWMGRDAVRRYAQAGGMAVVHVGEWCGDTSGTAFEVREEKGNGVCESVRERVRECGERVCGERASA
jgi:hypothetical protein